MALSTSSQAPSRDGNGPSGPEPLTVYRTLRSLTQAELAVLAGVSRQTVCNLERRRHGPRLRTALALAEALDVDPLNLFPGLTVTRRDEP